MDFFAGVHQPSQAYMVDGAFISRNRLTGKKGRKAPFPVGRWIMDSGAFTAILTHGGYPDQPEDYAADIRRWAGNGQLLAAIAQDFMCEPAMLKITGLTIADHQRLTIERYDQLLACDRAGVYLMPVLQGYAPEDYVAHIAQYGDRLEPGMWVGVGSVCKRNGDPAAIREVLLAIKRARPDLRLHGFGLKKTALTDGLICSLLHSADSMAWSYAGPEERSQCERHAGGGPLQRVDPRGAFAAGHDASDGRDRMIAQLARTAIVMPAARFEPCCCPTCRRLDRRFPGCGVQLALFRIGPAERALFDMADRRRGLPK